MRTELRITRSTIITVNTLLLAIISISTFLNKMTALSVDINNLGPLYLIFTANTVAYILMGSRKIQRNITSSILYFVALMLIDICIIELIHEKNTFMETLIALPSYVFWAIAFIFYYFAGAKRYQKIVKWQTGLFCVLTGLFFIEAVGIGNGKRIFSSMNYIYYPMMLLPVIFYQRKNNVRIILFSIACASVLISFKGTAILAFAASVLFYLIMRRKSAKFEKMYTTKSSKNATYSVLLIIIAVIAYVQIQKFSGGYIVRKMEDALLNGGSGRDVIWQNTWAAQRKSGLFEWLFGHTQITVGVANGLGKSSHNEYLETLFRYGLVFSAILFFLIVRSFAIVRKMIVYGYPNASGYMCSIIIFLLISLSSHTITYPEYFFLMSSLWAVELSNFNEFCANTYERNKC